MKFIKTLASAMMLSAMVVGNASAVETVDDSFSVDFVEYYGCNYGAEGESGGNIFFVDTGGHWGEGIFEYLTESGYFSGTSEQTFSPHRAMTKAEFITVFARLVSPESDFSEIEGEPWYAPFLKVVSEKPYFTADFDEDTMHHEVHGGEAMFALNTWATHVNTGLSGLGLYMGSHETKVPEASRFIEATDITRELSRGDCAILIYDFLTEAEVDYNLDCSSGSSDTSD